MSINEVLLILWRRGFIVALTLLTAILVAAGVLLFVPGRYDAVATASIDPGGLNPLANMGAANSEEIGLTQGNMLQVVASQRVALDVVRRLNLTQNPSVQSDYRKSDSFGRESIDGWMASNLLTRVVPTFNLGTNVLSIKYKSSDPNQAALIANAFLAATIDATIAMKAASAEQTATWFAPQLEELRREVEAARSKVVAYQKETNLVTPLAGEDTVTNHLNMVTQNLLTAKGNLTDLQTRLANGGADLLSDPADPDLQELNALKGKVSELETAVAGGKNSLGTNNPKVASMQSMIASIRKRIPDVTERAEEKVRAHLKQRIAQTQELIVSLEAEQAAAQKSVVTAQAQRAQLAQLQRDVAFRMDQLNEREKMAAQARLQSKLTFADIAVLDKATPPIAPAFPKPLLVIPVAIGGGLILGLILALLAEMTDRRVRSPADLEFAVSAPMLGVILKSGKQSGDTKPRRIGAYTS